MYVVRIVRAASRVSNVEVKIRVQVMYRSFFSDGRAVG
jgi:hypothetical protein